MTKVKEAVGRMKQQQDFSLSLNVKALAKETMKNISQVNLWWAKNFNGQASKLNDEFSVHFGDTYVDFRISEVIPDKKIIWLVTDCNLHWIKNKKEWKNTEVIWSLTEQDGKTQIDFVHKGLTPESECYGSCKPGWTHHLKDSLLKLIEKGKGFPE
jgi:Activator of Hsp90 ATPase homolog 1-like protein